MFPSASPWSQLNFWYSWSQHFVWLSGKLWRAQWYSFEFRGVSWHHILLGCLTGTVHWLNSRWEHGHPGLSYTLCYKGLEMKRVVVLSNSGTSCNIHHATVMLMTMCLVALLPGNLVTTFLWDITTCEIPWHTGSNITEQWHNKLKCLYHTNVWATHPIHHTWWTTAALHNLSKL